MCKPLTSKITLTIEAPGKETLIETVDMNIHWAQRLHSKIQNEMALNLENLQKSLEANAEAEFVQDTLFDF